TGGVGARRPEKARGRPAVERLEDRALPTTNFPLAALAGFEPTVAVDPNHTNVVAVAQYRTVLISNDRGRTFPITVTIDAPLGYTGGGDPSLSFDAQGDLCYGYMAGNPGPANSTYVNGIFAARIDPKTGVIEENQRVARETATSDHDKAWIAA